MGKILKQNVVLRPSELATPVVFFADQELPDEYLDQVGDHLFKAPEEFDRADLPKRVAEVVRPHADKDEQHADEEEQPEKTVLPKDNASKAEWTAFAGAHGISIPADAGRDDIRAIVHAKMSE